MREDNNIIKTIAGALDNAVHVDPGALDEYQIDLGADYPEPRYTLKLGGVGTFPRGDIQAVKAKSKNGKSFVCSIITASLLGCKDFDFETQEDEPLILYFDTEQNRRNTAKLAKRVHALMKWDTSVNDTRFRAYSLREMDMDKRWQFILETTTTRRPTMAIVDGIADLIANFNDIDESTAIIESLMNLSSSCDCCVTCVLHTNKAKDDSNMKGHLGTLLLQKSSDVLEVKKNGLTFNVTETDCRNNAPLPDFSFTIDRNGIPVTAATMQERRQEEKAVSEKESICNALDKIYRDVEELSHNEFVAAYSLQTAESESTAKRRLTRALELGLVEPTINRKYSRRGHRVQTRPLSIGGREPLNPPSTDQGPKAPF